MVLLQPAHCILDVVVNSSKPNLGSNRIKEGEAAEVWTVVGANTCCCATTGGTTRCCCNPGPPPLTTTGESNKENYQTNLFTASSNPHGHSMLPHRHQKYIMYSNKQEIMHNWAYNLSETRDLYTIRNDFPLMNICKYNAVRVIKLMIGPPKVY